MDKDFYYRLTAWLAGLSSAGWAGFGLDDVFTLDITAVTGGTAPVLFLGRPLWSRHFEVIATIKASVLPVWGTVGTGAAFFYVGICHN
jgi:hypothetical protein